jgi:octaprenyl-diphosphate synthase
MASILALNSRACDSAFRAVPAGRLSPRTGVSGMMHLLMHAVEKTPNLSAFEDAVALAHDDMQAVDRLISAYDGEQHIRSAAIIEFIHTATLLHDDVVDSSARRRGRDTANTVFGNQASVLVGDFLYSRAFQMMVDIDSMRVMQILADATNTIAAGEVMQLMNVHDPDTTEESYRQVIYRKTARLFEAGAQIAAVLADRDPGDAAAMITYGKNLGAAFQLVDDALDYNASADELGKNIGDDLAEGKATLPLIYAMQQGSADDKELIRNAIVEGGLDQLDRITAIIDATGALDYTARRAQESADTAIAALSDVPESEYKQALIGIAEFSVRRRS